MYIPLYNKTTYTLLSSLLEVDDLIEIALKNKLTSIAICDDNLFGAMEFIKKCQTNNLKPIIGLDLEDRLLYAKNYKGYQNLLKLTTIKSERNLTNEDYIKYKSDLICIPLKAIDLIYETVFYPLNNDNQNMENVIYINKNLYKDKNDYEILKYIELLRENLTITANYEPKKNYYYKDVNVSKKALLNTFKLCDMCNLELPKYELKLAIFDKNVEPSLYLTNLANMGLKKRLKGIVKPEYQERLNKELNVIINMGYANYIKFFI